eukprot:TRINITY_DN528_c0_g1_i2.p2 TRINITY_DN528_c0_g1~~TRINITY_DN528_c0_g1_i2.p2  ORF type:complete len:121 (+),score=34.08 TRINITY_DN528_c0_g1_i2:64-426(+)
MATLMNRGGGSCSDRVSTCAQVKAGGLCATPIGATECRKTCNACTPRTPPIMAALAAADPPQPRDTSAACVRLSGFCDTPFVAKHCRATCARSAQQPAATLQQPLRQRLPAMAVGAPVGR